ncbi:hypothetical protein [uncultured Pseudodesulfovibrio sp.]|uniref:hypothetical protein n=1 Tax=uncultured Pseudodesulfovibrio sp. TaxID=2035858 RepID=UPI0029C6CC9D|nr:hypothetical protein [uncultured Pseudodesulfovibrio sp.]
MPRTTHAIAITCAIIGALLIMLNIAGIISPNDQRDKFPAYSLMPYTDAVMAIEQLDELPAKNAATKLNALLKQSMIQRWPTDLLRIPARQNYLLWAAAWLDPLLYSSGKTSVPNIFSGYQLSDHHKALQRGFGICSQIALTMSGFLHNLGIDNDVIGMHGHVIVQVNFQDGTHMLADPSKGLTFDFGINEAPMHMKEISTRYENKSIPKLYASQNYTIVSGGITNYFPKLTIIERAMTILIWVIPCILMAPYAFIRVTSRKTNSPRSPERI